MSVPKYSDYRDQLVEMIRTDCYIATEALNPVLISWHGYDLPFKELYFSSDTEQFLGGGLFGEANIRIGQNDYVITEIHFYYNHDENDCFLYVDSVELSRNVFVNVGGKSYEFENCRVCAGLSFHPNGAVMSGKLVEPAAFDVGGNRYTFSSIGFWEDGRISGGKPTSNTIVIEDGREMTIMGEPQVYFDNYTVSFTPDGKINWAELSNGTTYNRVT